MRRWRLVLSVTIVLLGPGVVRWILAAQELPRGPAGRLPEEQRPLRPPRLGAARSPQGACVPEFDRDIAPLFANQPAGSWTLVSADCSSTPGCNDYFWFTCASGGERIRATFCSNGGEALWDTDLSLWEAGTQTLVECAEAGCGDRADLDRTLPAAGDWFLRVGGAGDASGPYALAVNMPATCFVGSLIAVDLQTFTVD